MSNPEDVHDLVEAVDRLNDESDDHFTKIAKMYKRSRRLMVAVTIGLLLDITITVLLGFGFYSLGSLTDKVDYSQTVTRHQVLCPLYQILINTESAQGRARFPAGPEAYDKVYEQLNRSYMFLNCNKG